MYTQSTTDQAFGLDRNKNVFYKALYRNTNNMYLYTNNLYIRNSVSNELFKYGRFQENEENVYYNLYSCSIMHRLTFFSTVLVFFYVNVTYFGGIVVKVGLS